MRQLMTAKIYYDNHQELMRARETVRYNSKSEDGEFDNLYNVNISYFDEDQNEGKEYIKIALYEKNKKNYIWKEI